MYLESFTLPIDLEERLVEARMEYNGGRFGYIDNPYPCGLFAQKQLREIWFDKVTIFYGGNGSGKSTLLNLIAEDEALKMQLFYGKEGRDYLLEDGYYVSVKQEDGSRYNLDFLSCLSYFSGLSCESGSMDFVRAPGVGNGEEPVAEGKTLLQTHRELLDESAVWYPLQHTYSESALRDGILCFDFSGYSREITDMAAILDRYFRFLTNPNQIEDDPDTPEDEFLPEMTEEVYQQMLQELKDAGSDRVLAELQRQLSQWQAAHTEKEEGT